MRRTPCQTSAMWNGIRAHTLIRIGPRIVLLPNTWLARSAWLSCQGQVFMRATIRAHPGDVSTLPSGKIHFEKQQSAFSGSAFVSSKDMLLKNMFVQKKEGQRGFER